MLESPRLEYPLWTVIPIRAPAGFQRLRDNVAFFSGAVFGAEPGVNPIAILDNKSTRPAVWLKSAHDGFVSNE